MPKTTTKGRPDVMNGSAALFVVPAELRASHGDTDFYVLTSDSAARADFVAALVAQGRRSRVPFSPGEYPSIADFLDSVSDCVLVGLVDAPRSALIEATLSNRGHALTRVAWLSPDTADSSRIRRTALDMLQTAVTAGHDAAAELPRGEAEDGALLAFYARL